MITYANRLKSVQEYYFSAKLKQVRQLALQGKPIINMGIGSPDLLPDKTVLKSLKNSLLESQAHQYQSYQGIPEFRFAIANFYKEKYGVVLNSETEVLPLMGSKEGIMHISLSFLNKEDKVLIPNPGYPTYSSVSKLLGAKPVFYSLSESNNWQPDFEQLETFNLSQVKLMWVNYPHMPTGAKALTETFQRLVSFGKKHNILIVNDNPYSFILNNKPLSILQVKGAKEIALELNSLSKTFNMAGWRVGMLLGSKEHLNQVFKVKTQMDSGMFYGIQKAAAKALELDKSWYDQQNKIYKLRQQLVFELAQKLHCSYNKNSLGMFVWAKLTNGLDSEKMTNYLLYDKHIFVAPGTVFGNQGQGYIRFSLCVPEAKIKQALTRF
ncbi:MAG: pyridoxal phosphate-dependent aminotransferase [Tenacibaculum sp.]